MTRNGKLCLALSLAAIAQGKLTASSDAADDTSRSGRSFLPMTKHKMSLVMNAIMLNNLIYKPDEFPEDVQVYDFHNGMDRMFTQEYGEDYCFVTWMGTDTAEGDWDQNFNSNPKTINGDCVVHEGFWQAYSGSGNGYSEDFVPILTGFIESCNANGRQLVFTGHSQGGSAAGIAHIIWSEYKPITINFGAPPFLEEENMCASIPESDIWRFINSENKFGTFMDTIVYDPIPNLNFVDRISFIGFHVGGYIVLPPGDEEGNMVPETDCVSYFGPENPDMDVRLFNLDFPGSGFKTGTAHQSFNYLKKLEALYERLDAGDELDCKGFINESMCHEDGECRAYNILDGHAGGCANNFCHGGETGDPCKNNDQCFSGRCDMYGVPLDGEGVCYDKLGPGAWCNEDSDCRSGNCSWFRCKDSVLSA